MSDTDTQHEEPAELADKLFLSLDDQITSFFSGHPQDNEMHVALFAVHRLLCSIMVTMWGSDNDILAMLNRTTPEMLEMEREGLDGQICQCCGEPLDDRPEEETPSVLQ